MITTDAYGHTVTMTTDGITDTYLVGGARNYSFPAGTPDANVAISISVQANLLIFNDALTEYVNSHYTAENRLRWTTLYLEFQYFNQPNKLAYVAQLLSWGNAISTYTAVYIGTLMAKTNLSEIAAMVFDPTQFSADPAINLLACMQIVG